MTDTTGIAMLEDALSQTWILSEGCNEMKGGAENLPVSWAVFSILTATKRRSLLVLHSTQRPMRFYWNRLYDIDPQGITLYLERNFSFMNF